ncbi:MAG: hypothetical protein PHS95_02735 [Candidatus Pacebacteria bacterium]|nr:hypothetical protein [Candidatus Paceibacterota bacterium]
MIRLFFAQLFRTPLCYRVQYLRDTAEVYLEKKRGIDLLPDRDDQLFVELRGIKGLTKAQEQFGALGTRWDDEAILDLEKSESSTWTTLIPQVIGVLKKYLAIRRPMVESRPMERHFLQVL